MLSCSLAATDEPLIGTAAAASFWVALEQPGPWGKKALTQSGLDPEVGAALERAAKDAGGRAVLIRPVGRHVDATGGPRTVLLSGGDPRRPWLLRGRVDDPRRLIDLPFGELTADAPALAGFEPAEPAALVCTNAKRDQCCARLGRPVALAAAADRPGRVWECSHLGGHRFAATALVLPTAQMLGRLDADLVGRALDAAARGELLVDPAHERGRTTWRSGLLAAADTLVRAELGEASLDGVALAEGSAGSAVAEVRGARYRVELVREELASAAASCGAEPTPRAAWRLASIAPLA